MKRSVPQARSAFTLIELLVATALLLLMLAMLVGVINSVTSISSRASSRLDALRLGREVFDLMQKDLGAAVLSPPFRGTNGRLQFVVNPADSLVPADDKNPTAFFWQAPVARDRSQGDLAVVGYFVQHIGTKRSQLRRVFVEPNDTNDYQLYTTNGAWLSPALITKFSGSTNAASTGNLTDLDPGWVANGVLGLWVRCVDSYGNVITSDGADSPVGWSFDSKEGFQSGSGATTIVRTGVSALPTFVDVGIVCIASRDVDRVDAIPSVPSGSPGTFDADMQSYLKTFTDQNPRVKTALALTRRFRISGGSTP